MRTIKINSIDKTKQLNLEKVARQMRRNILEMIHEVQSGHPGGSLSSVEILASLYFSILKHDPINPSWEARDKFILSKAHACPVLYVALAQSGYFPESELLTFRKINSRLQGHAHIKTPGVEMSGGSLGQGLSFGVGSAIAARLNNNNSTTYVLLGDGECDEGQIWEAAMSASHHKLDNLVAIVDRNGIQNDRFTHEAMNIEPFEDKWRSFGWDVASINGHSFQEIIPALNNTQTVKNTPSVIIAKTVKGKGVSFMENNPGFHGKAPSEEELVRALEEIKINPIN